MCEMFPETDTNLMTLSNDLRWLRKMRKLTLKQVSQQAGLSISFLSDVERGRTQPSLRTLEKLVDAYNSPISVHITLEKSVKT